MLMLVLRGEVLGGRVTAGGPDATLQTRLDGVVHELHDAQGGLGCSCVGVRIAVLYNVQILQQPTNNRDSISRFSSSFFQTFSNLL